MNLLFSLAIVAVTAVSTLATRAAPFLLFGGKTKKLPPLIERLGRVLPPAVMAILVVYSIKEISFATPQGWVKEILAIALTVLVHLIKRNTLLSICCGTALYMVLVQGFLL
ncbi:MAG: branched-chain amino acid transporter permease [Sphaerochaetaceae bacterium]